MPLEPAIASVASVLLGKEPQIRLALTCLLARGHLLLEDMPGVGKTTLAEALARCLGLHFKRVHFTADLLPADLTGINVFEQSTSSFHFHPGPLFTEVLLADEINRASPRTQSALLECMASGRISVEGISHSLPEPFVVIASQNGLDQSGTAPLPESQLDRFMMRLSLGFPDPAAEMALLSGQQLPLEAITPGPGADALLRARAAVQAIHASESLLHYILDLVTLSRREGKGLSPRAALSLLQAAKAWAYLHNQSSVSPDAVQAVFSAVAEHRLDGGHRQSRPISVALLSEVDAIR